MNLRRSFCENNAATPAVRIREPPGGGATMAKVLEGTIDRPPTPATWRRLLPDVVVGVLWGDDDRRTYDAFLSYSWAADRQITPVLQSVLQRFLCPWYRTRALNIFRDLSSLAAGSSLEGALSDRLDRSKHLIVCASPGGGRERRHVIRGAALV